MNRGEKERKAKKLPRATRLSILYLNFTSSNSKNIRVLLKLPAGNLLPQTCLSSTASYCPMLSVYFGQLHF